VKMTPYERLCTDRDYLNDLECRIDEALFPIIKTVEQFTCYPIADDLPTDEGSLASMTGRQRVEVARVAIAAFSDLVGDKYLEALKSQGLLDTCISLAISQEFDEALAGGERS
jgi:hypothetical protein